MRHSSPSGSGPDRLGCFLAALPLLLGLAMGPAAVQARNATPPAGLQGVVSRVVDGNTLALTPAGAAPVLIHLRDIDAPGLCQAWGEEARRALSEWALNRPASVRTGGRDSAGRVVGVVFVEGVNLNQRMVEEGHAWSVRTRWDQGPMVRQERMAHSLGRGLHGVAGSIMPRDFRRAYGKCPDAPASP